jgi:hypothetical protein
MAQKSMIPKKREPVLGQDHAQKKSRRRRRLEGDNREASNRVDRSHSMSMKMDAHSNDRESLTTGYQIAANA